MATYRRFEELPAWQAAADLYSRIDELIDRMPPLLRHSYREQLERTALAVSNHIAEGFERGSSGELIEHLHRARGAAGELRSLLVLGARRPYLANFRDEIGELVKAVDACSRQLRAWARSMQEPVEPLPKTPPFRHAPSKGSPPRLSAAAVGNPKPTSAVRFVRSEG